VCDVFLRVGLQIKRFICINKLLVMFHFTIVSSYTTLRIYDIRWKILSIIATLAKNFFTHSVASHRAVECVGDTQTVSYANLTWGQYLPFYFYTLSIVLYGKRLTGKKKAKTIRIFFWKSSCGVCARLNGVFHVCVWMCYVCMCVYAWSHVVFMAFVCVFVCVCVCLWVSVSVCIRYVCSRGSGRKVLLTFARSQNQRNMDSKHNKKWMCTTCAALNDDSVSECATCQTVCVCVFVYVCLCMCICV